MRIAVIGDVHGSSKWSSLITRNEKEYDKLVFLGDYVDDWWISDERIKETLADIIFYAEYEGSNTVKLLIGNHDYQYINPNCDYQSTGFRERAYPELHELFSNHRDLFSFAYQVDDVLFTHAGVCHSWFTHFFEGDLNEDIATQLNHPANLSQLSALTIVGTERGGWLPFGGPLWCDQAELKEEPLKGYTQVVGHTRTNEIEKYEHEHGVLYFADCLENIEELPIFDTKSKKFI